MSNRYLITIYKEDIQTGIVEKQYSKQLSTDWTIEKIKHHFEFNDGFALELTKGHHFSYLDFTCINVPVKDAIKKADTIPESNNIKVDNIPDFINIKYQYQSNELCLSRHKNELIYSLKRVEIGASGFSEYIAWFATEHPLIFGLFVNALYDIIKSIFKKIKSKIFKNKTVTPQPVVIKSFPIKNFYKRFSSIINVDTQDLQITKITKFKSNQYKIIIKTFYGDEYKVICNSKWEIISFK